MSFELPELGKPGWGTKLNTILTNFNTAVSSLSTTYARVAGQVNAPHVQLGPTTKTLHEGIAGVFPGVLAFQNNAPDAPDVATRIYIVPSSKPVSGVGGALKIFGDPYIDGEDYRDFGLYFSADQSADTGHQGQGVFWLNSKVQGVSYTGKNPDIGFSFQDGSTTAGRFSYLAASQPVFVVGPSKPGISAAVPSVIRLEVQGDMGFDGSAGGKGIRWYRGAGLVDNLMRFNNSDVQIIFGGAQRLKSDSVGNLIMGDEATALNVASTGGFFYLRSMGGTPTGVPVTRTGTVPLVVDSTAGKLWARIGGAWKSVTFA